MRDKCRFARTLDNAGDGDVLRQERYENARWCDE